MKIQDLKPAISLLKNAGLKIKSWRNDSTYRKIYSKLNLKTEADMQSHNFIYENLIKIYPGIDVISEENYSDSHTRPDTYWLIDPIDGTASWYNGFDGYVTQASFICYSEPIFGVIFAPEFEKIWVGIKGSGAELNGKKIKNNSKRKEPIFIDNTKSPHGITKEIMTKIGSTKYLESGSIGLKSVLVADGSADVFVKDVIVRDWDLAPAYVVLKELGCNILMLDGKDFTFSGPMEKNEGFVIARDSILIDKVISSVNKKY